MEFRATFPLSIGSFDIFHPIIYLPYISPYVPMEGVLSTTKTKTDEYIVLPGNGKFNVKFGEGGKSYDVKYRRNEDLENEDWLSVAKGSIVDNPGDVIAFATALRKQQQTEANSEIVQALDLAAGYLEAPGSYRRVFTRKNLTTLKAPTASGKLFVVEQIDFSIWDASAGVGEPKRIFRSVSLEGEVPEGVQNAIFAKLRSAHGDRLIMGGFPYMVEVAIGTPTADNQMFEV